MTISSYVPLTYVFSTRAPSSNWPTCRPSSSTSRGTSKTPCSCCYRRCRLISATRTPPPPPPSDKARHPRCTWPTPTAMRTTPPQGRSPSWLRITILLPTPYLRRTLIPTPPLPRRPRPRRRRLPLRRQQPRRCSATFSCARSVLASSSKSWRRRRRRRRRRRWVINCWMRKRWSAMHHRGSCKGYVERKK